MKRTATILGIAAALAVPATASAGISLQMQPQVTAQVVTAQIAKPQIVNAQRVTAQRVTAARKTAQRATGNRISLHRSTR